MIKTTLTRSRFAPKYGHATFSYSAENALLGVRGIVWAQNRTAAERLVRAELRKRTELAKMK